MPIFSFSGLTDAEIVELAKLAAASYVDNPIPDGWIALTGTELGFSPGLFSGSFDGTTFRGGIGFFGAPAAQVYRKGNELTISFRGTDTTSGFLSALGDGATFLDFIGNNNYINAFTGLLDVVEEYATQNGLTDVNIVGHSLGGAAANLIRNVSGTINNGFYENATYLTLATPTVSGNPNIFNIGFENDWVFEVLARINPFISSDFFSATDNLVLYDDAFAEEDFPGIIFDPTDTSAHSVSGSGTDLGYVEAIELVINSAFYDLTTRDSNVVIVDTNQEVRDRDVSTSDHFGEDTFYVGRLLSDTISAGIGNDFIDGNAGDDVLEGGEGNDAINGGSGEDFAIFNDIRQNYTITETSPGTFVVNHVSGTRADGVDTLTEVEFARFSDEIISLGQTQSVDVVFLQDLSSSFSDDLPNVVSAAPQIINAISGIASDSQFGVASFIDFPFSPFGAPGDFTYRADQVITADSAQVISAINSLSTGSGGDFPEAQLTGLLNSAQGAGLGFRAETQRFVILSTDAPFQTGPEFPTVGEVRSALEANNGHL